MHPEPGTELCESHTETCGGCYAIFCPSCFIFHRAQHCPYMAMVSCNPFFPPTLMRRTEPSRPMVAGSLTLLMKPAGLRFTFRILGELRKSRFRRQVVIRPRGREMAGSCSTFPPTTT